MIKLLAFLTAAAVLGLAYGAAPPAGKTLITWYGHSAFKIVTPGNKVLLLDPWITNPANPSGADDLAAIKQPDLIFVSHAHFDHVGNAVELGKRTGAQLVATLDVGRSIAEFLGYPKQQATPATEGNYGGQIQLLEGEVTVAFVPAVHSSAIAPNQLAKGDAYTDLRFGGAPAGFVISIRNGPRIYFSGDTDLFQDMRLISNFGAIDLMLVCIGDHFTMGPGRAADAVALVSPRMVIPMHFGTQSIYSGTPDQFSRELKARGAKAALKIMQIGKAEEFGN